MDPRGHLPWARWAWVRPKRAEGAACETAGGLLLRVRDEVARPEEGSRKWPGSEKAEAGPEFRLHPRNQGLRRGRADHTSGMGVQNGGGLGREDEEEEKEEEDVDSKIKKTET